MYNNITLYHKVTIFTVLYNHFFITNGLTTPPRNVQCVHSTPQIELACFIKIHKNEFVIKDLKNVKYCNAVFK